jgi:L-lactate dehydrogenase (cytochrome)
MDLRAVARHRLPSPLFHYLDGAAETEMTAKRNTAAFDDIKLIPNCLVDVSKVKTATRILGQEIEWPVLCSPTGASRFWHPQGELAAARAAGGTGTLYCLSMNSTYSLEEVARVSPGPKLFQLYVFKDREITRRLIERCRQAGYKALCLTVDTAVTGNRERDRRSGWGVPIKLSIASALSFAWHPRWLLAQVRHGPISMPNVAAQTRYIAEQLDPSVTWNDVRQLIAQWNGPFAIKGIMSVDDSRRAADLGASAVFVSNHGGRQLDGAAASVEALPQIARAVGSQVEVILDGGVRRGVHVLKALALGAKACSIGRPYLYGLGANGEEGVRKALDILRTELVRAMQLSGCTDVNHIDLKLLG